ncbi:MAG: hypothetical protein JXC32_06915 [Anaerolineae bacterium]|nr:hypothetical protein [Anaerolineae bacterium]
MAYQSGDDPRLLSDLRAALKRWRRPTLGDAALAHRLADVERRLAADPRMIRSNALRQTLQAALASLRDEEQNEGVDLLERHYFRNENVVLMAENRHLSERSLYHRLYEAQVALAHALWAQEPIEANAAGAFADRSSHALLHAQHLPPKTATQLFGVGEMLAQLLAYLEDRDHHWVISLAGMAGLGKTALAREAAGRLAATDRFADIAWVMMNPAAYTSRGLTRRPDHLALTCSQVLNTIVRQLSSVNLDPFDLPTNRDRVRELLHAHSYLVVLDNLETPMDCGTLPDWFWGMANPSKFLLTSRHWLEADVEASVLSMEALAEPDGLALIRHEAHLRGRQQMSESDEDALHQILAVTGGNPLAIKLVMGQLKSLPLSRILTDLKTVQPGTETFYRYLYRLSWDLISMPARHLLVQMVRLPASGGTWEDLAAIVDMPSSDLSAVIEALVDHSLVQVSGFEEKIYSLHPLTYHFASRLAAQKPGAQEIEVKSED